MNLFDTLDKFKIEEDPEEGGPTFTEPEQRLFYSVIERAILDAASEGDRLAWEALDFLFGPRAMIYLELAGMDAETFQESFRRELKYPINRGRRRKGCPINTLRRNYFAFMQIPFPNHISRADLYDSVEV